MAKSDVSLVTHLLPTVNEGFTTTLGATISSGATSLTLNSATGLVDGSTFVGIIEPAGTNQQVFTGIVDVAGVQITGVKWTRGANVSHSGGVTIVDYVTGTALNMITKWAAIQHNDDGTHKALTTTTLTTSGVITSGGSVGVTGNVTASGSVNAGTVLTYGTYVIPTVVSTASASTITPSLSTMLVTALAANLTINAPSGSPVNGQKLLIRIKDNGTARTLTWNAIFRAGDIPLPTTTVISKTLYVGFIYNAEDTKWDCVVLIGNF